MIDSRDILILVHGFVSIFGFLAIVYLVKIRYIASIKQCIFPNISAVSVWRFTPDYLSTLFITCLFIFSDYDRTFKR